MRERIRSFFLQPRDSYFLGEAAQLLGVSRYALIREAESDRREEYREGHRWRFTWRQLAYVAFRTWSLAEIEEALGADAAKALNVDASDLLAEFTLPTLKRMKL